MLDFKIKQWQKVFGLVPFMMYVDPPTSYTTHYNLKKYGDGDDPGAAALNDDKDLIDTGIFSASVANLTATVPLVRTVNDIALSHNTTNLKITSNALNTIQNIATSSAPTFQSIYIADNIIAGTDPYASIFFFTGSTYQFGDITLQGNILLSGSIWLRQNVNITGSLKVKGNTDMTGSLYVSASLVSRKLVINPALTSSGYIGTITASEEDYFKGIGLPPEYDVFISGSMLLAGGATFTGSVTSNATSKFNNGLDVIGTASIQYDNTARSLKIIPYATASVRIATKLDNAQLDLRDSGIEGYASVDTVGSFVRLQGNQVDIQTGDATIDGDTIWLLSNTYPMKLYAPMVQVSGSAEFLNTVHTKGDLKVTGSLTVNTNITGSGNAVIGELHVLKSTYLGDGATDRTEITGSLNVSNGITGSFFGSIESASHAETASYSNVKYASMYAHGGTTEIQIASSDVYYPLTQSFYTSSISNDFTFVSGSALKCISPGVFNINWHMSVAAANNNQEIETTLFVDDIQKKNSEGVGEAVTSGKAVSIGNSCNLSMSIDNILKTGANNLTGTSTLTVYGASLSIIKVG